MLKQLTAVCGVLALVFASAAPARALTAMETVERALQATERVEDYTATIAVAMEAPNVNIARRQVKVWYKQPDKVHVESEGVVIIPRDALLLGNLALHLKDYATASFAGEGEIAGRPVRCVKLAPRDFGPGSGRVLLWIDSERYLLLKSEVWRGGKRQLAAGFHHTNVSGYWMPEYIITDVAEGALRDRTSAAHIELQFMNYRINTGLPDSIFREGN
ncbi:MAG: sigma-E factor regulatory protein RseB domain-containing protein [Armatimonadota bacterium]